MSPTHAVVVTLIALLSGLWVRRSTWRNRWESAGTINLATIGFALLFMTSATAPMFDWFYYVTGVWNLEDMLGHVTFLVGVTVLAHATICRLDMAGLRRFLRWRIELPATVMLPTIVGAFVAGSPDYQIADLIESDEASAWMKVYWILFSLSAAWVLAHLLWALLIIVQGDPRSETVAAIYVAAVVTNLFAVVGCTMGAVAPWWPNDLTWMLICLSSVVYAVAAIRGMCVVRRWWRTDPAPRTPSAPIEPAEPA